MLSAAAWAQAAFPTAEAAVRSLEKAASRSDDAAIKAIFGPDYLQVFDEDRTQRIEGYRLLTLLLEEGWTLAPLEDGSQLVRLGAEGWPLPIPIVAVKGGWSFNLAEGAEELLNRRIGRNELMTIETLLQLCVAEKEYASEDRDGDGIKEYTTRFVSTPGLQDGLYWLATDDQPKSPLEKALASSKRYAEGRAEGAPWWGYYYRALPGQASDGQAISYSKDGQQTEGFAFVAYPANYGKSGIMTFVVNQDGVIYQKDLGAQTLPVVVSLDDFDPADGWTDDGWTAVDPENP
jgi:hypothetical protein